MEEEIGIVGDYFARVGVAGIDLRETLKVGERIHIKGHTTDLELQVLSMEIDRQQVQEARAGQSVGVKVDERVRKGDRVYKVID